MARRWAIATVLPYVVFLALGARPAGADTNTSLGTRSGEGSTPFTGLAETPGANLFTGASSTSIKVEVPPGRKNITPNLVLQYSSSGGPSPYGFGWDLPLGRIQRSTKWGVPRACGNAIPAQSNACSISGKVCETSSNCPAGEACIATDQLVLTLPAGTADLIAVSPGSNVYRPRVEESYLQVTRGTNSWTAVDRSGLTYTFGDVPAARIGITTGSCPFITAWGLTKVQDTNGNYLSVTYASTTDNVLYPSSVDYGGNTQAPAHFYHVTFTWGTRPEHITSYLNGAPVVMTQRLNQIDVTTDVPTAGTLVRRYAFTYDGGGDGHGGNGEAGYRSILTTAQVTGSGDPAQTFSYAGSKYGMTSQPAVPAPAGVLRASDTSQDVTQTLLDMNRDGMVDIVVSAVSANWTVYTKSPPLAAGNPTVTGFAAPLTWTVPSVAHEFDNVRDVNVNSGIDGCTTNGTSFKNCLDRDTLDINGDGIPDFVDASTVPNWTVYLGYLTQNRTGSQPLGGFGPTPVSWPAPVKYLRIDQGDNGSVPYSTITQDTIDMNGDGLPDLVVAGSQITIYLNTGSGFAVSPITFNAPTGGLNPPTTYNFLGRSTWDGIHSWTSVGMMDMNGDGLIDLVAVENDPGALYNCGSNVCVTYSNLRVFYNTGQGFSQTISATFLIPGDRGFQETLLNQVSGQNRLDQTRHDLVDINGDGLPDWVGIGPYGLDMGGPWYVALNQGDSFEPLIEELIWTGWTYVYTKKVPPSGQWGAGSGPIRQNSHPNGSENRSTNIDLIDIDGDGLLDRVDTSAWTTGNQNWAAQTNQNFAQKKAKPNLMTIFGNGFGGTTTLLYAPATGYDNTGGDHVSDLPFIPWVTTTILQNDGLCATPCTGHDLQATYRYQDGRYDSASHDFRGFRVVSRFDPGADPSTYNQTTNYFAQGNYTKGKVLQINTYAGSGASATTAKVDLNYWSVSSTYLSNTRTYQLWLNDRDTYTYDLSAFYYQALFNFNDPPDSYGNIGHTYSSGMWDGEVVDTHFEYATPQIGYVVYDKPKHTWSVDANGVTVAEKWFIYDGGYDLANYGTATMGNLTAVYTWLDQTAAAQTYQCPTAPMRGTGACIRSWSAYDTYGNITDTYDGNNNRTNTVYDSKFLFPYQDKKYRYGGDPNPLTITTLTDYKWGKPQSVTDPNGAVTLYQYDTAGRLYRVIRTLEDQLYSTQYTYHFATIPINGQLSWVQVQKREPNQTGSSFASTSVAQTPNFLTATEYFDGLGRHRHSATLRVVDGADQQVISGCTEYDAGGRVTKVYDPYRNTATGDPNVLCAASSGITIPNNGVTTYDYLLNGGTQIDPLGRVHAVHQVNNSTVTTYYYGRDRLDIDADGNSTFTRANDHGWVTYKAVYHGATVGDPPPSPYAWTDFAYDGAGRLDTTQQNSNNNTTITNWYDSLGHKIRTVDPDSGTWTYLYDAAGNLVYQDDPKFGQHVQFQYDGVSRILEKIYFSYPSATPGAYCDLQWTSGCMAYWSDQVYYIHDSTTDCQENSSSSNAGIGRLHRVDDASGSTCFTYDARGRTTNVNKSIMANGVPKTASTSFTYDLGDHLRTTTYPDNEALVTCYNGSGQVSSLSSNTNCAAALYASSLTYDLFGRLDALTHTNGVNDHRGYYDPAGSPSFPNGHRLQQLWTEKSGTNYLNLSYAGYSGSGLLSGITDARNPTGALSNSASFTYDLGRLKTVTNSPNLNATYDYDALGNMILKEGTTLGYSATQPHTLATINGSATGLTYDANGNQSAKPGQTYGYDADDHLNNINNGAVQLVYDYTGQRVAKVVGNSVTRYYSRLAEVTDTWLTKYYYAGGMLVTSKRVAAPVQLVALPHVPAVEVASLPAGQIPAIVVLLRDDVHRNVLLAIAAMGAGLLAAPWRRKRVVGIAVRHGHVVLVLISFSVSSLPLPLLLRPVAAQTASQPSATRLPGQGQPAYSGIAPDAPAAPPLKAASMAPGQVPSDPAAFGLAADAVEIVGKRTLNAKHFQRADGSFTAVFAAGPLHYHAADGSLQDLDLDFHAHGNDQVMEGSDTVRVRVPKDANALEVTDPVGNGVRWLLPRHPAVDAKSVAYRDTQGVRWTYESTPLGVKHSATLMAAVGARTYTFAYELLGDQSDFTIDADGNAVAHALMVPRAMIRRADGTIEPAGPWRLAAGGQLQFDYDDSALPRGAFPYVIDPTTVFVVAADADDGSVGGTGSTYPPACSWTNVNGMAYRFSGSSKIIGYGVMKWDTSSLWSAATITSASFVPYVTGTYNADSRNFQGDWYNWAPSVGCPAYTTTAPTANAFSMGINSLVVNAANTIPLSNLSNINTTGITYLRVGISGGAPTGSNYVLFNTHEQGSNIETLQVNYTQVLAPTSNTGRWDNAGNHTASDPNYVAGQSGTTQWHDFFVFNLAGISGTVTAAAVQVYNPASGYAGDANETYTLFDVSTPVATLTATGAGQTAIYNDLGSGTSYGARVVSAADNATVVEIPLNAAGGAAINAALGNNLAVGGALTGLHFAPNYYMFNASGGGITQLVLKMGPAPSSACMTALSTDNPIAEFHLGEAKGPVAADATNHYNNGTYSQNGVTFGLPSLTTDSSTAVSFSQGSVSIADAPQTLTAYSIETWIKPTAIRPQNLIARTDRSGVAAMWSSQLRINANGKVEHYLLLSNGTAKLITGTTTLQAGRVYHLVGTATNNGVMHLYVNGVEEGTPLALTTMWDGQGGGRWVVAEQAVVGQQYGDFGGTMDEVAIYSTQLSASRVTAHYQACAVTFPTPTPASTTPTPTPTVMGGGSASGELHYHTDHLGSVELITNSTGGIYQQIRYKPYGDVRGHYDSNGNLQADNTCRDDGYCHEFTQYDTEPISGLQYAGARFYDPGLGQFLTHDPARQFASPYTYTNWNPTNDTDPDGQCVEPITGLACGAVGLIIAGAAGVAMAIDVGIKTGDPAQAVWAGGMTAGSAAISAPFGLGILTGAGVVPVIGQALQAGLVAASLGAAAYGTYESFKNGYYASGMLGAVLIAYSVYEIGNSIGAEPAGPQGSARRGGILDTIDARLGGRAPTDEETTQIRSAIGSMKNKELRDVWSQRLTDNQIRVHQPWLGRAYAVSFGDGTTSISTLSLSGGRLESARLGITLAHEDYHLIGYSLGTGGGSEIYAEFYGYTLSQRPAFSTIGRLDFYGRVTSGGFDNDPMMNWIRQEGLE